MINILVTVLAVLAVGLNVFATSKVATSSHYEIGQKWSQVALIWLLPIVGAILAWSLTKDSPPQLHTTDLRDYGGAGDHDRNDSAAADIGGGDGGGD